jgi:hypothetical protein
MITDPAKAMESQFWFDRRLQDAGITVSFAGVMNVPQRWEVIRTAIVNFSLADATPKGTTETFRAAYERATGSPLIPAQEHAA